MEHGWPKRIVVGVDHSDESLDALDHALALAQRAGGRVVVVHAVGLLEEGAYVPRPDLDELAREACARTGCPASILEPPVAEDGRSIDVILRVAERVGCDLVVVGRRGAGAAARPLGSSSAGIVDRAEIPVLVVAAR